MSLRDRLRKTSVKTTLNVEIFDTQTDNPCINLEFPMDENKLKEILQNNNMEFSYDYNEVKMNNGNLQYFVDETTDIYYLNKVIANKLSDFDDEKYGMLYKITSEGLYESEEAIDKVNGAIIYKDINSFEDFIDCNKEINDEHKNKIKEIIYSCLDLSKFNMELESEGWYFNELTGSHFYIKG